MTHHWAVTSEAADVLLLLFLLLLLGHVGHGKEDHEEAEHGRAVQSLVQAVVVQEPEGGGEGKAFGQMRSLINLTHEFPGMQNIKICQFIRCKT